MSGEETYVRAYVNSFSVSKQTKVNRLVFHQTNAARRFTGWEPIPPSTPSRSVHLVFVLFGEDTGAGMDTSGWESGRLV
jgi:hypothetical protein